MTLDLDLGRWEAGEISPEELERLHPDAAVRALVALHERLSTITDEPLPDADPAMERMLAQLPDRARRAPRRGSRVLLLAATAVLLTASMAVAVPGLRSSVSGLARSVGGLFGDDAVAPPTPAAAIIDRSHPSGPGEGRGVPDQEDTEGTDGSESGDGEQTGGSSETSGSDDDESDDESGSSESSGGESEGDGGSLDQESDGEGSDRESSGGDGSGEEERSTDGLTDPQTEES